MDFLGECSLASSQLRNEIFGEFLIYLSSTIFWHWASYQLLIPLNLCIPVKLFKLTICQHQSFISISFKSIRFFPYKNTGFDRSISFALPSQKLNRCRHFSSNFLSYKKHTKHTKHILCGFRCFTSKSILCRYLHIIKTIFYSIARFLRFYAVYTFTSGWLSSNIWRREKYAFMFNRLFYRFSALLFIFYVLTIFHFAFFPITYI